MEKRRAGRHQSKLTDSLESENEGCQLARESQNPGATNIVMQNVSQSTAGKFGCF